MKPPAFQFYADDFMAGTADMTDSEAGLYIRLLCVQWSRGSLPNDVDELLRFSRGSTTLQAERVRQKFDVGADGRLRNARLEKERQKQAEWREKSRIGGLKSAQAKGGSRVVEAPLQPPYQPNANSPLSTLHSPSPVSGLQSPKVTPAPKLHVGGVNDTEPTAKPAGRFAPPSLEEVKLQCAKTGLPDSEAVGFMAYYESNGWRVGRNPMRSWPAALTNWKKNWTERNGHPRNTPSRPAGPAPSELQPNLAARLATDGDEWPDEQGAKPNPVG